MAKTADANHLPKVKKKKFSLANLCLVSLMIFIAISFIVIAFYFHLRTKQGFFIYKKNTPRVVIKRNHITSSSSALLQNNSMKKDQLNQLKPQQLQVNENINFSSSLLTSHEVMRKNDSSKYKPSNLSNFKNNLNGSSSLKLITTKQIHSQGDLSNSTNSIKHKFKSKLNQL